MDSHSQWAFIVFQDPFQPIVTPIAIFVVDSSGLLHNRVLGVRLD